jgi:hypothetical protein
MAASLLAAFRHLGLPDGDLRKASITTLRFRRFEVPGRIHRGQGKTWLHPARRLALDPRPHHWLADDQDPADPDLTRPRPSRRPERSTQ